MSKVEGLKVKKRQLDNRLKKIRVIRAIRGKKPLWIFAFKKTIDESNFNYPKDFLKIFNTNKIKDYIYKI